MRHWLFGNARNSSQQLRSNVSWNFISALLNSIQSVVLLMLVTRKLSIEEAGIFSLAFTNANMLLNLGCYGIRNYHATDLLKKFSFSEYATSRMITSLAMILVSLYLSFGKGYSQNKSAVFFFLCLLKCIESIEDLFFGEYQRQGRLDVVGKEWTLRLVGSSLSFTLILLFSKDLLLASKGMLLTSIAIVISLAVFTLPHFEDIKSKINYKHVIQLMKEGLPLCLTAFLSVYLSNAPKYSIDVYLSEAYQTYYAILFMPVFVINLFSGFIYKPILTTMANHWLKVEKKQFVKIIVKQFCIIVSITAVVCIFAKSIELPILSLLYGVDISGYLDVYLVLLVGGGANALVVFFIACLTVIRQQNIIAFIMILCSFLALVSSDWAVKTVGIMGAGLVYTGLMFLQVVAFIIIVIVCLKKAK